MSRSLKLASAFLLATVSIPCLSRANDLDGASSDRSPWGIASGAEWAGEFPRFNPLLRQAGVTWLRYFPEWQTIQRREGTWSWGFADRLVVDARANGIRIAGCFAYAARFATSDGTTRTVPLSDNKYWSDYVAACVTRYREEVRHWEVWNEFNGSFSRGGTPKIYAELVRDAYVTAKKIDPETMIGMSVANFDVGFLDAAIRAGAADHFDYVCVHPYENLAAILDGGEMGFLSLAGSLRRMLADNDQRENLPLWITEIGTRSAIRPDPERDARQADALVLCYVLSIAQGFDKIFWFEARGPAYGRGTDHGIIRSDWSLRPAYHALRNLTSLLGATPEYLGWLDIDSGGFGFVFRGAEGPVLVAWSPLGKDAKHALSFEKDVTVVDVLGESSSLAAGRKAGLTRSPVFVKGLPASRVAEATANRSKNYPWGVDYSRVAVARCFLGASNRNEGLAQKKIGTTEVVHGLDWSARKSTNKKGGEGHYIYFRVDPSFAGFGNRDLEITVVARRHDPNTPASFNLLYESSRGYKFQEKARWTLPAGEKWVEHSWKLNDANFVGAWGWNFRTDAAGSRGEFQIKEVRVKKTR